MPQTDLIIAFALSLLLLQLSAFSAVLSISFPIEQKMKIIMSALSWEFRKLILFLVNVPLSIGCPAIYIKNTKSRQSASAAATRPFLANCLDPLQTIRQLLPLHLLTHVFRVCLPSAKTHSTGQSSLFYAALPVWNTLPSEVMYISSNRLSKFDLSCCLAGLCHLKEIHHYYHYYYYVAEEMHLPSFGVSEVP